LFVYVGGVLFSVSGSVVISSIGFGGGVVVGLQESCNLGGAD